MTILNFIENLRKVQLPVFSHFQIFVDFGTSNTRIAIKDRGLVLNEPTVIGYNKKSKEYIFFGKEAKLIIGKVPDFISIIKPVINGIVSEFDAQVALGRKFVDKAVAPYIGNYAIL